MTNIVAVLSFGVRQCQSLPPKECRKLPAPFNFNLWHCRYSFSSLRTHKIRSSRRHGILSPSASLRINSAKHLYFKHQQCLNQRAPQLSMTCRWWVNLTFFMSTKRAQRSDQAPWRPTRMRKMAAVRDRQRSSASNFGHCEQLLSTVA